MKFNRCSGSSIVTRQSLLLLYNRSCCKSSGRRYASTSGCGCRCNTRRNFVNKFAREHGGGCLALNACHIPICLTGAALLTRGHVRRFHIDHWKHCQLMVSTRAFEYTGRDLLWLEACAAASVPSMPGRACAILLKSVLTLWPSFALVSTNIKLFFFASSSPCWVVTSRLSFKSVLLPTSTIMTSFPRSARTSSIHFLVFWKDLASGKQQCQPGSSCRSV